jgi:hypothetical protein
MATHITSPCIYQGKIYIETNDLHYLKIEEYMNHYFENESEYCNHPIIRPFHNEDPMLLRAAHSIGMETNEVENHCLFFSIPFDNNCKLKTFEKDILKIMNLIEDFGKCKIKESSSYINVFEVFRVEDPVQYKYMFKRKDVSLSDQSAPKGTKIEQKLVLMKQIYQRDIYVKMKSYLKKSTKENLQFYETLFQS